MSLTNEQINVLVVDNNPVLLKTLSSMIIKEGCAVKTAENGLEALEVLREWPVDIVFTDLVMPLVEGDVLCRVIKSKEQYKRIFVAILSAIVAEDRERVLRNVPCDLCFSKGSISQLKEQVKETLYSFQKGYVRQKDWSEKEVINLQAPINLSDQSLPSEATITKELLVEKDHLRKIFEDLTEGIIELNDSGKVVRANSAVSRLFNRSQEDMIGVPINKVIHWQQYQSDINKWLDDELIDEGSGVFSIDETEPLSVKDNWITADFSVVKGDKGCFGICIIHDITRQFLAEKHKQEVDAAIELMKKMEAMRGMAGGVAHDFNNLLTVICGNLDIVLASQAKSNLAQHETTLIENAKKASLVAVDLTRTISCFSSFGIVHRIDYDLNKLITKSVENFFNEKPIPYKLELSETTCKVQVDPAEIELIINNILENSIESLEGEAKLITIISEEITLEKPQLLAGQYIPAGIYGKVDLIDQGRGISSQFLSQVFDPYYSTKERSSVKGMGLGLAVVYSVMRNHGGYAVVDSINRQGTIVSLFFPVYHDSSNDIDTKNRLNEKTVLQIEDDSQLHELSRVMLEYLGCETVSVTEPISAIAHIQEIIDQKQSHRLPDVILFDISQLHEIEVLKICDKLKELHPNVEIVGISGSPLGPVMENCQEYGISNTLTKPYTLDSLKHVLTNSRN